MCIRDSNRDARITTIIEGDNPGIEEGERENPWGFIPIVQFSNERDPGSAFGKSELEVIEPFIKAYHDVMLHAIPVSYTHLLTHSPHPVLLAR